MYLIAHKLEIFPVIFNPDAERGVISYNDGGNSNAITVKEFEVTDGSNSISTSNETAINNRAGNKTRVVFDSNANKFVVSYSETNDSGGPFGQANIVTSQKTALTLTTENFIGFAKDAVADGAVATIQTANSIARDNIQTPSSASTFGSAVVFESGTSDVMGITFDSNSNKVVIVFRDQGDSEKNKRG